MSLTFCGSRGVYVSYIYKARKDNSAVKKGEPYIMVKQGKYSPIEYFKDVNDLNLTYPKHYRLSQHDIEKLLKEYKTELRRDKTTSPKEFLTNIKFGETI